MFTGKKQTFQCIGCSFKAITDKVPCGFYYCPDCQLYLGFCRRCINEYVKRHLIRDHNNVPEGDTNGSNVQQCPNG